MNCGDRFFLVTIDTELLLEIIFFCLTFAFFYNFTFFYFIFNHEQMMNNILKTKESGIANK